MCRHRFRGCWLCNWRLCDRQRSLGHLRAARDERGQLGLSFGFASANLAGGLFTECLLTRGLLAGTVIAALFAGPIITGPVVAALLVAVAVVAAGLLGLQARGFGQLNEVAVVVATQHVKAFGGGRVGLVVSRPVVAIVAAIITVALTVAIGVAIASRVAGGLLELLPRLLLAR